jgi:hypothetical protein
MECNFCNFKKKEIIYEDDKIWIVNTKDRKGHKERIMVVTKMHAKSPPAEIQEYAIEMLIKTGKEIFNYVPLFCVMSDTHSRFPNHWHRVASDFRGDDIEQIIDTDFAKIWVRKLGKRLR